MTAPPRRRCSAGARLAVASVAVVALVGTGASLAAEAPWWLRGEDDASLRGLGDLVTARAVAIAPAGVPSAAAYPSGKDGRDTELVLRTVDSDGIERLTVPGEVRAMRFADRGATLLLVVAKRSKRRPPETYLVSLEPDSLRARRRIALPHTTTDVTFWPERASIVVACRDELRTFTYPELTSGPLFRLLGQNLALARIDDARFVVANERGLVIVDLADRAGEDEMPIRAALDPGAPVVELAVVDDPPEIAARRAGDAAPVRFDLPPTEVAVRARSEESAPIVAEIREAPAADVAPTPEPTATDEPAPTVESVPIVAEIREAAEPDDVPDTVKVPPPPPVSEERTVEIDADAVVAGSVEGATGDVAIEVVALGPDNLFREAVRVPVRADGSFAFGELAPGTYRIVLDAGGERWIQTEPAFHVVRVEDPPEVVVRSFRVVRVR